MYKILYFYRIKYNLLNMHLIYDLNISTFSIVKTYVNINILKINI